MKNTGKTLFRSDVARGVKDGKKGVDRENGAIYSFAVISNGEAKGHGMEIDDIALKQIVELGNKIKIGVKSRFGHPNMSNTALGTFLGRVKNFWKDGDVVRGDIHLDKTAHKTPNGDLASYVMDLAENDPDAFGTSIVFDGELEERLNEDGTRKKDEKTGEKLLPLVRFKKLFAVDTVDNPAANDGMFGSFFSESVQISADMTAFLEKFLNKPDAVEKTITFLQRYAANSPRGEATDQEKYDCSCVDCGHKETYEDHCNKHKCPECGGQMRRVERPGPGQEKQEKNENKGVKEEMEITELTLEMLKEKRSDLVEQLSKEGLETGVGQERLRAFSILKEAKGFEEMEELALEAIEKGDSLEVALGKFKSKKIVDLEAAAPKSTGPNTDKLGKGNQSHLEKAKAFKEEHGGSMTDALKATAEQHS